MNLLLPGTYVAADSALHRLDPRVKMGATLLLMAIPFTARSPVSTALILAFVATIALLSSAPGRALLGTLRGVFWLGCFMFAFHLFTTPGQPLIETGRIVVTREGLLAGGVQIYRLCLLVIVASLLTFTTSPSQLAHGLEAILEPLARVGLPVREAALVLTIALRFVPTFFEEIEKIAKAQRARGVDLRSGGPWRRLRGWVAVFVPIFVTAFRRAEELATAMEARGFRGTQHRTRMVQLRLTRRDLIASLVVVAFGVAVIGLERLG
jgi:energy-coupling factor transport system permease protein